MNPTRLCMLGAGGHASCIVYSCLPLLQNARVVANSDLDEERATSIARKYGIERSYTNFGQMLAAEKPDGVIICVGLELHARAAIELKVFAGIDAFRQCVVIALYTLRWLKVPG